MLCPVLLWPNFGFSSTAFMVHFKLQKRVAAPGLPDGARIAKERPGP